ncbi:MAG: LysM peptidoglycan-binding domain-containing protein [Candidatus Protochlamydia sp.]|nr:LysM peptidoglycan-binding domain-containing protein [Candidatus Protochlamydia sp.]
MNASNRCVKLRGLGWSLTFLCLTPFLGWSAPYPNSMQTRPSRPIGNAPQPINLSDLKHELNNHETEIRIFENKLQNQEMAFDEIRQQVNQGLQEQREMAQQLGHNLERKIQTMDNAVQGIVEDLRQIKTQANGSLSILDQYKTKLIELESLFQAQSQHMAALENALQSLADVWQAKEASARDLAQLSTNNCKTYKVQPGDSLGKIAVQHKVSVESVKERNRLQSDRINVGQTLIIP